MSKRERIEDLGRLAEKLDTLLDDDFFLLLSVYGCNRAKDFTEMFKNLNTDQQYELLHSIAYGIERIKDQLHDCSAIADGREE